VFKAFDKVFVVNGARSCICSRLSSKFKRFMSEGIIVRRVIFKKGL
jgi:hypothetical protein